VASVSAKSVEGRGASETRTAGPAARPMRDCGPVLFRISPRAAKLAGIFCVIDPSRIKGAG